MKFARVTGRGGAQVWAVSADDGDDLMDEDTLLNAEDLKPKVKAVEDESDCATARIPPSLPLRPNPWLGT
jgi:hypothetical protein